MTTEDNTFRRVDWFGDQPLASDEDDELGMPIQPPRGPGLSDADLELLKLAARALGAERVEVVDGEQWVNLYFADGSTMWNWNPLLHGDDTFNLAVELDLDVLQSKVNQEAQVVAAMGPVIAEPWGDDKKKATQRAITRAAAEIVVAREKKEA